MTGFAGTGTLLRLAARRDRVLLPTSILAVVGLVAAGARATIDLYPDPALAIAAMQDALSNPAVVALYGPVSDPSSIDSLATFKTVLLGAVFVVLLVYVVVRRHTRTEEEEGRLELLGGGVVGRRAPLTAAVLLATAAVLVTTLLVTVASVQVGLDETGSIALGVAWATAGLTWVGVTAVAAQLAGTARGAAGFALGTLAVAYMVRVVGDGAADGSLASRLSWLSPLGWVVKVEAYGANRLWVGVLGVLAYIALVLLAYVLLERRDLGSGIFAGRAGPARGGLRSTGALARRLATGTVAGWVVGVAVLASVMGSVAPNVETFLSGSQIRDLLTRLGGSAGTLIDTFFATELGFASVAVSALGIALVLRLRSEETAGRAESVLATRTSRIGWAVSHLVVAVGATALVLAVMGVVLGLVRGGQVGDVPGQVASLGGAALARLPAVWVCLGVALAFVGLAPRWTGFAWGVLLTFFALGEFGELLQLPEWLVNLSPFAHLPRLPGADLEWLPLVALVAVATALVGAGLYGFRNRDIA
ncbi:polyketide antibiotic transporter [Intrasporangium sp. DVR]|uniref:ABC transporter permease n=1 Tax=Intrasporangium sp. DVR TaxID=3127867 RepID=UPI00313A5997